MEKLILKKKLEEVKKEIQEIEICITNTNDSTDLKWLNVDLWLAKIKLEAIINKI